MTPRVALVALVWAVSSSVVSVQAAGDLSRARAHWVAEDLVLWDAGTRGDVTVWLHHSADASLAVGPGGVTGGSRFALERDEAGAPARVRERFPHLASLPAFRVPAAHRPAVGAVLRGQVAIEARDPQGAPVTATGVQIAGAIDDLFTYGGPLGPDTTRPAPTLRVWAPTARQVRLHLFDSSDAPAPGTVMAMDRDEATGVWSATVEPRWRGRFYLFEVRVFAPATGRIETTLVTDPYSVSLSINSRRSQIVDLSDPALAPEGWTTIGKPALEAPEDAAVYELHIRDFSVGDETVRPAWRGGYLAFTEGQSAGMRHLASLARAGLTHVHLLPSYDIATIDEDRSTWEATGDLSGFAPDSDRQQARVTAIRGRDGFNWGYDPWHYNVPEGSYATEPDGAARVREFRAMVAALNRAGLRVVLDVVYNHTMAAGQDRQSVLDRIVPGYYHRLDADGRVHTSTCCSNTASEHAMMEKLMIDSVVLWATQYKVDGFRFDLMGHHLTRNMTAVRAALDALTPERDGVDGRRILVYGEGWNFGEVADGARGENAVQRRMAGTGIATFSDRLRDAARGGGASTGLQEQGWLTGLALEPNAVDRRTPEDRRALLLAHQDRIKVGLAGNLRDVVFTDVHGRRVRGDDIDYNGAPAGYAADPQETVTYVEAHDNETLWDAIQLKAAPATPVAERVRMQMLGLSLVAFAQGIPFFHAGGELLRSKSLDRNSYDSGDWFNRLDVAARHNNWGVGVPPAPDNAPHWPVQRALLADPALRVGEPEARRALAHFVEVLAIRRSSPLFRLRTAGEVATHLRFLEAARTMPGVIAMELADPAGRIDPRAARIVVVFNASPIAVALTDPSLEGAALALHPLQRASADEVVRRAAFDRAAGRFDVPGRTAAVFVEARSPAVPGR